MAAGLSSFLLTDTGLPQNVRVFRLFTVQVDGVQVGLNKLDNSFSCLSLHLATPFLHEGFSFPDKLYVIVVYHSLKVRTTLLVRFRTSLLGISC